MTTLCWWIGGRDTDRPFLAYDLHNEDGNLIGSTRTVPLQSNREAKREVQRIADDLRISDVVYDHDSTECFAED